MPKPDYQLVISDAAKADLKDIYQYGLRQWGKAQSDRYLEKIKAQLWLLTEQPMMGTDRPELISGNKSLPVESHTLYYRVISSKVEIIRILHGRQDPSRHIE